MRMLLLHFLIFFCGTDHFKAYAQTDDSETKDFLSGTGIRLSTKYFKGEILVYDCTDKHFVCTSIESATICRQERDLALDKNRFELPCAPIKAFKSHEECSKDQYKRVHDIPSRVWCFNEKKLKF